MILELEPSHLLSLLCKQLDNLFTIDEAERKILAEAMTESLRRTELCFSNIDNKYYWKFDKPYFNPFHSGQYCVFLYFISNEISEQNSILADKIYYLNKALNGLDLFHEVAMPDVFFLDHPVGTVIGRATIGRYFCFGQNCTLGSNKGVYPTLGSNVNMCPGAMILGNSKIGDHVLLAANAYVKDEDIPSCSIVFGSSPNLTVKPKERSYFLENFHFEP